MPLKNAVKAAIKRCSLLLPLVEQYKYMRYQRYLKRYNDEEFVRRLYERRLGEPLNLQTPQIFTEKMQWLKLYYRDDRMVVCSDKYELKRYLADRGYGHLTIPTLAVFERAEDIQTSKLPYPFILKATNGSGWNVMFDKKSVARERLAKRLSRIWLKQSAYLYGREWNYKDQTPRMMAEPLISTELLIDYKCMCFGGEVRAIHVNHHRNGVRYVNYYDPQWHLWEGASIEAAPCDTVPLEKPTQLETMLAVAADLAKPFPFVRVDFYEVDGRLYIGEMTFFPGSGFSRRSPQRLEQVFGDWLVLPEKNQE